MQQRASLLQHQDVSRYQELAARVRVRVVDASGLLLAVKPRIRGHPVRRDVSLRLSNLCG
jgi:hypothetical protein